MICSLPFVVVFFWLFTAPLVLGHSTEKGALNVAAGPIFGSLPHAAVTQEFESSLIDLTKDQDRITSLDGHEPTTAQIQAATRAFHAHLRKHVPRWVEIRNAVKSEDNHHLEPDEKTMMPRALQDVIELVSLVLGLVLWVVKGVLRLGGHFDHPLEDLIKKAVDALAALLPPQFQTPGPYIGS